MLAVCCGGEEAGDGWREPAATEDDDGSEPTSGGDCREEVSLMCSLLIDATLAGSNNERCCRAKEMEMRKSNAERG